MPLYLYVVLAALVAGISTVLGYYPLVPAVAPPPVVQTHDVVFHELDLGVWGYAMDLETYPRSINVN